MGVDFTDSKSRKLGKSSVTQTIDLLIGFDPVHARAIVFVDDVRCSTVSEVLFKAPQLKAPEHALLMSKAVNHLVSSDAFRVIANVQEYKNNYHVRLDTENPSKPLTYGPTFLSDFGTPDFEAIRSPKLEGELLTFCASDRTTGLPYEVSVDLASGSPDRTQAAYKPLPLV